jgi:hypothetical protein
MSLVGESIPLTKKLNKQAGMTTAMTFELKQFDEALPRSTRVSGDCQTGSRGVSRCLGQFSFGGCLIVCLSLALIAWGGNVVAQDTPPAVAKPASSGVEEATAEEQARAAWEFRPYQVAVWLCTDGSPNIMANLDTLSDDLLRRSELIDPSGWMLTVSAPSSRWRWAFLQAIEHPESHTEELAQLPELAEYDKLIAVCLTESNGVFRCQARELDIRTQQWGSLIEDSAARFAELGAVTIRAISRAFMPIARVDRVTEKDEVYLRVRAMQACNRAEMNEEGKWIVAPITDSPVWIDPRDRFLPVIRFTDRQGNLTRLEPVEFTFLTIEKQEGPLAICSIQSFLRAPLAGRQSKRAQKLALVIRPPDRSTVLKLVSRGKEAKPLEGYEVWSGFPGAQKGEFELLGKTDWKGTIEIPPSERGMRILYVAHGSRRLTKLPIIPGLHDFLETTVPDDETRLYAEGVISGLNNEILNLVAQRNVFESEIDLALKKNELDHARELLVDYQNLTSPQDLKTRLADEESRLQSQTENNRELDFIDTMFDTLREILDSKLVESRETELLQRLQDASLKSSATQ